MRMLWALGEDKSVAWGLSWALHSWCSPLTAHSTLSHCDRALPVSFSVGGRVVLPGHHCPGEPNHQGSMAPGCCGFLAPGYSGIQSGGEGGGSGGEGGEVEDSIGALVTGPNSPVVDTCYFLPA